MLVKFMAAHSLKRLDLSNNRLTCEGAIMLAKSLETSGVKGQLKRLNLSLNNIGKAGCFALCQVILRLVATKRCKLQKCASSQALHSYEPMQYLDLSSNRIDGACAEAIAKLIGKSKSMKELKLACNKLGREAGERILEDLEANDTLLKLDTREVKHCV